MSLASVARRERELENGNMRIVALEQVEERIACNLAENDSDLYIVRAILKRIEARKVKIQRDRQLASELEQRGRQGRRAA